MIKLRKWRHRYPPSEDMKNTGALLGYQENKTLLHCKAIHVLSNSTGKQKLRVMVIISSNWLVTAIICTVEKWRCGKTANSLYKTMWHTGVYIFVALTLKTQQLRESEFLWTNSYIPAGSLVIQASCYSRPLKNLFWLWNHHSRL